MVAITPTQQFSDVYLIQPQKHSDERGFFMESFRESWLAEIAPKQRFVQDNHSFSKQNVLRGLHYQLEQPQAKLVRVVHGRIFDVVVDMRRSSPTFGKWQGFELSADNHLQLWIPEGFAHGFYTLSETAECLYRCTHYYHAPSEQSVRFDDPHLNIHWPLLAEPLLSPKDANASSFNQAKYFQ